MIDMIIWGFKSIISYIAFARWRTLSPKNCLHLWNF